MKRATLGKNCIIDDDVTLGLEYREGCNLTRIGDNAIIRAKTIIYGDVEIGDNFRSGHFVLIREKTKIGDNVLVGTHTVIDGYCTLGNNIKLQTGVYLPTATTIGNNVFIGPRAVFLNDKYPVRARYELRGPCVEDDVTIGANATILPAVRLGRGAFIAAGAVVTRDVPEGKLAQGNPARTDDLPKHLKGRNNIGS